MEAQQNASVRLAMSSMTSQNVEVGIYKNIHDVEVNSYTAGEIYLYIVYVL